MNYIQMKNALSLTDNPMEKLEMVMDFGKNMPPVPDGAICHEIHGCASFVEICQYDSHFFARADSLLVRGIVAILLAMIDGKSADEIKQMDLGKEFSELNLNLGAGRMNGLNSMISFLQNL